MTQKPRLPLLSTRLVWPRLWSFDTSGPCPKPALLAVLTASHRSGDFIRVPPIRNGSDRRARNAVGLVIRLRSIVVRLTMPRISRLHPKGIG